MGINADSVVKSMFWLIAAYLFHTLVNYVSVGLSYVSKLVPAAWIGIMFSVLIYWNG
jgi:POT family proton-dependent oligopeptide transporter